jgi:opacity protein-like surface antigen
MPRRFLFLLVALVLATVAISAATAQQKPPASPPAEATVTIAGKVITIKYGAPSVRGRDVFGAGGVISKDKTFPVWRTGANSATSLVTEADLEIKGLAVPKGSYTLFTQIDAEPWQFIVNKQTGQWGLTYNKDQDLGRVAMDMSRPPAPVEMLKITLTATGANSGKLEIAWENKVASVPFTVK